MNWSEVPVVSWRQITGLLFSARLWVLFRLGIVRPFVITNVMFNSEPECIFGKGDPPMSFIWFLYHLYPRGGTIRNRSFWFVRVDGVIRLEDHGAYGQADDSEVPARRAS